MLIKNKMCTCKECKGITIINGSDGVGIVSITDNGNGTFTILMSNGNTFISPDYTGPQGIQGIPGLPGINGTNGTNGTNGVGITSIVWTSNSGGQPQGTQGTTDTYTINLSDLSSYTFLVTNGANGTSGTVTTWVTRTNANPPTYTIPAGNTGIINSYDTTSNSEFTLPNTGLSIGDFVEIIDNKTTFPSETRVVCPVGVTIKGFNQSTTTRVECEASINGTIKLVYVAANTWIITNYLYDNATGIFYPTFI